MSHVTRQLRRLLLLLATIALAGITAQLVMQRTGESLPVLDDLGGEFSLPSTLGREVALSDYRGELVLLNFGFTSCPDVCPTVLAKMRALLLDLDALGIRVQPLFVTLDPERDSVPTLTRYLEHFHPALVGMTGSPEQIATVAARYRVLHEREPLDSALGYGITHSSHIYLIDSSGRVRAMFGGSHRLSDMLDDTRRLAAERS
jgi:protein SCO1/2